VTCPCQGFCATCASRHPDGKVSGERWEHPSLGTNRHPRGRRRRARQRYKGRERRAGKTTPRHAYTRVRDVRVAARRRGRDRGRAREGEDEGRVASHGSGSQVVSFLRSLQKPPLHPRDCRTAPLIMLVLRTHLDLCNSTRLHYKHGQPLASIEHRGSRAGDNIACKGPPFLALTLSRKLLRVTRAI
jgi:hypothetical protein